MTTYRGSFLGCSRSRLLSGLEKVSMTEVRMALLRWGVKGGKKRRSLEGKVYFYDRGIWALFLGMNPLEEGGESREKET